MPAAAAPAEEGENGNCYGGANGQADYSSGGERVIGEGGRGGVRGESRGRNCRCHVGLFLWGCFLIPSAPLPLPLPLPVFVDLCYFPFLIECKGKAL
jgi:hypothetical protein